jgi:hypothetical protein
MVESVLCHLTEQHEEVYVLRFWRDENGVGHLASHYRGEGVLPCLALDQSWPAEHCLTFGPHDLDMEIREISSILKTLTPDDDEDE